jgi:hypothetical protein
LERAEPGYPVGGSPFLIPEEESQVGAERRGNER